MSLLEAYRQYGEVVRPARVVQVLAVRALLLDRRSDVCFWKNSLDLACSFYSVKFGGLDSPFHPCGKNARVSFRGVGTVVLPFA